MRRHAAKSPLSLARLAQPVSSASIRQRKDIAVPISAAPLERNLEEETEVRTIALDVELVPRKKEEEKVVVVEAQVEEVYVEREEEGCEKGGESEEEQSESEAEAKETEVKDGITTPQEKQFTRSHMRMSFI